MEKLQAELKRLKQYFPYRIVWGYIDNSGDVICSASHTKRAMNKAAKYFTVYTI